MKRLLILALVVLILASTVLAASAITSTSDDVLEEKAENLVTNPSFESGYGQEIPGWEIKNLLIQRMADIPGSDSYHFGMRRTLTRLVLLKQ